MAKLAKLKRVIGESLRLKVCGTAIYGIDQVVDLVDFYKETQETTTIEELKVLVYEYGYDDADWEATVKRSNL